MFIEDMMSAMILMPASFEGARWLCQECADLVVLLWQRSSATRNRYGKL